MLHIRDTIGKRREGKQAFIRNLLQKLNELMQHIKSFKKK